MYGRPAPSVVLDVHPQVLLEVIFPCDVPPGAQRDMGTETGKGQLARKQVCVSEGSTCNEPKNLSFTCFPHCD